MLEDGILPAMVEVQVGVDHQVDVGRAHVQIGERVGGRAVDHPPVAEPFVRAADAGIDQHRAAWVGDHEAMHRPFAAIGPAQVRQVQPLDLQRHR